MKAKLVGVPETLLIPLWARAAETGEADPIIRDEMAVEIMNRIDYDFSRFNQSNLTQVGVAIRTMLLDRAASAFLDQHPDAAIINLGAGLDTRCVRINLKNALWYDLDLPDPLELRKRFFLENAQHRFIAGSMFDLTWMDEVDVSNRPVLFIAEGLFMYFEEKTLKPFFRALIDRFPGSEMLMEMIDPLMVGRSTHHETIRKIDSPAEFKWGLKDSRKLLGWNHGIEILNEWNYLDYGKKRWKWAGVIMRLPFIRISQRIVHLRLGTGSKKENRL